MEKPGYRSIHKTGVQINVSGGQNQGTDQFTKQGYRSIPKTGVQIKEIKENQGYRSIFLEGKTRVQISFSGGQNQGTDQFTKQGYRSVFLDLKWPFYPPQHRVYIRGYIRGYVRVI